MASQLRIEYDPYTQKIRYNYRSSSTQKWQPLATGSPLIDNEKYQHVALLNVLDEIIPIIHEYYNFDSSGLEIVFCGTDDDFDDLQEALKRFYLSGTDNKPQMRCIKHGDEWYSPADEIIPDVESIFAELEATFSQHDNIDLQQLLANYKEAVSPIVPVCVMGTYSAGKSAFINSLIGYEILPSDANPLTAKIFKIVPGEACTVQFTLSDILVKVVFENGEAVISHSKEPKVGVVNILNEVAAIEKDSNLQMLAKAISIINKADDDIDMIEITLPFHNTTLPLDRITFEIYDTPGSDSETHKDHAQILASALQGRSNGLPILVTEPTKLDTPGTAEIISIINRVGSSLDRNNIIIAINKADTEDAETLKSLVSKSANTVIKNWKVNRMIFVSAAMALGCKKTTSVWNDSVCRKTYRTQKVCFADPQDEDYLSLPQCNKLPEKRKLDICQEASSAQEKAEKMPGDTEARNELIAHNSGIRGVESEIAYYAKRHANYNKCRMAILYLAKAISDTKAGIEEKTKAVETKRSAAQQEFDDRYNCLIRSVNKLVATTNAEFNKQVTDAISADTKGMVDRSKIINAVVQSCKEHKSDLNSLNNNLCKSFIGYWEDIKKSIFESAKTACSHQVGIYKEACVAIINGDSQLTPEEKKVLEECVWKTPDVNAPEPSFDIHKLRLIRDKKFLFFKIGKKVNPEECATCFINELNRQKSKVISLTKDQFAESFKSWSTDLKDKLLEKAKEFNPDLRRMNDEIMNLKGQIEKAEQQLSQLTTAAERIEDLTKLHTK